MAFQDNNWIALKRHDLLSDKIYQVYSWYIPCIYYAYTVRWSLVSPLSCPSALGSLSLRPGLPAAAAAATTQHRGKVTRTMCHEATQPAAAPRRRPAAPRRARRRRRGERRSEPFVGRFIPWHNCHGGAWNETLWLPTLVCALNASETSSTGRPRNLDLEI
jgi:hypothetical protein